MTSREYSKDYTNVSSFFLQPSVFIGCGGLGSHAINYLKNRINLYLDVDKCEALQFLSIDSANTVIGEEYNLPWLLGKNETIMLDFHGWKEVKKTKPVKQWYPEIKKTIRQRIERTISSDGVGCGTMRIFGRLSLYCNKGAQKILNKIKELSSVNIKGTYALKNKMGNISVDTGQPITFFVVSTLGGGTGTGLFMDVAAIIRKVQKDLGKNFRIIGIFVLPTILTTRLAPSGSPERVNANSYAALRELQHFLSGNPFEADYGSHMFSVRCDNNAPENILFNLPFLVEGKNNKGKELGDRQELADYISRMMFQLSLTEIGGLFFQRNIDIIAYGANYNPTPNQQDTIIDAQRPLFCNFGHATIHIPLPEIIEYTRLVMAKHIVEKMAKVSTEDNNFDDGINNYFLTPSKQGQPENFIDAIGLGQVIDLASSGRNSFTLPGQKFCGAASKAYNKGGKLKKLMGKSRRDIKSEVNMLMENDADEEEIRQSVKKFLDDTLKWDLMANYEPRPVEESPFSKAVETAIQKKGAAFVVEGLAKLDEYLTDVEHGANNSIAILEQQINNAQNKRMAAFNKFRQDCEAPLAMVPLIGKKRLEESIEDFLKADSKCKEFCFKKIATELFVEKIAPAYHDQIEKWKNQLDKIEASAKKVIECIKIRYNSLLDRDSFKPLGTEIPIHFDRHLKKEFLSLYAKQGISVDKLLHDFKNKSFFYNKNSGTYSDFLGLLPPDDFTEFLLQQIKDYEDREQAIFSMNFDNMSAKKKTSQTIFSTGPNGEIEKLRNELEKYGLPMTTTANHKGKNIKYYFSASKTWQKQMAGKSRALPNWLDGLYKHKITSISFQWGIAPFQLSNLKDWYEDYRPMLFAGEPLHLFRGAKFWDDPYTKFNYEKSPAKLLHYAKQVTFGRLLIPMPKSKGNWRLNKECQRKAFKKIKLFQGYLRFHILDNWQDIIAELDCNEDLYDELANQLARKLMDKNLLARNFSKLLETGVLPYDIAQNDYSQYLSDSITSNADDNPVLLFKAALKAGVIQKTDKETVKSYFGFKEDNEGKELYSLEVHNQPETIDCDWCVHGTLDDFKNELNVNEVLYEQMCELMVLHVYSRNPENWAARKKNYAKLCEAGFLPPFIEESLREEYKIN